MEPPTNPFRIHDMGDFAQLSGAEVEAVQKGRVIAALLKLFHRAQAPGIVIALARFLGHDPDASTAPMDASMP